MPLTVLVASLAGRVASMPWAYVLLWLGSLVLSIVLVVLLRTRWGQSRPLHKCAVLSLLVHLLLAWAAMTVHFIAGDGSGPAGSPIRVRIVRDEPQPSPLADIPEMAAAEDAPPLLEAPPEPTDESAPDIATVESPSEPQLPEPEKSEPPADVAGPDSPANELSVPSDTAMIADTNEQQETTPAADEPAPVAETSTATTAAAAPTATAESESDVAAAPYSLRTAPDRLGVVERQGGSARTEAAVAAALRWLAAVQSRDGRWDANQFGAGQEQAVLGHNRGGAGRGADTGITALALLAFLGAGHSHLDGEYQDTVRRGLDFLLRSQAADGSLFGNATLYAQMYCHSMATFALAEAQAMTGDHRLRPAVTRAVDFCLASQNTTTGGWRYRPGDTGDTSQLGWQMMALASAERAGIALPSHTWVRIERFLRSVRRGSYGGLASYRPDSGPSTSMTAEAFYCRLLLGDVLGGAIEESAAVEATSAVLASLPETHRLNLYYWYYATLALHRRHPQNDRAASDWQAWNASLTTTLLATQQTQGADAGSWDTNTVWGGYGGRVYTTAVAAMCLEVYYRYAPPAPRGRWTAARNGAPQSAR